MQSSGSVFGIKKKKQRQLKIKRSLPKNNKKCIGKTSHLLVTLKTNLLEAKVKGE